MTTLGPERLASILDLLKQQQPIKSAEVASGILEQIDGMISLVESIPGMESLLPELRRARDEAILAMQSERPDPC